MPYADPEKQRAAQADSAVRLREIVRSRHVARRREQREIIRRAKGVPCADCDKRFHFFVMDFDHVRGEKRYEINQLSRTKVSNETLLAEIAKCDVVCSNCHRLRTFARLDAAAMPE